MRRYAFGWILLFSVILCGCNSYVDWNDSQPFPTQTPHVTSPGTTVTVQTPTGDVTSLKPSTTSSATTTTKPIRTEAPPVTEKPSPVPNAPEEGYTRRY